MKIANYFVILAAVPFVLGGSKGKGHRQYNEQCVVYDTASACDSSQGLICLDSGLKGYRCMCPSNKLHAQVFDTRRNACVGKVLNACVPGSSKNLNDTLCVDNAECNSSVYGMAVCLCKPGYTERDDGTCTPSLKHGDTCISESDKENDTASSGNVGECDEKHGQKCIGGKCQCRYPTEQYYDEDQGKCVSYASGRCSGEGHVYSCVANAHCPAAPVRLGGTVNLPGLPELPPFLSAFAGAASDAAQIFVMPLGQRLPQPPPPSSSPFRHPLHYRPPHHHHPHPLGRDEPMADYDTRFDDRYDHMGRSIFFGGLNKADKKQGEGDTSAEDNQPRCQCMPGFTKTAAGYCMKGHGSKCNPNEKDAANTTKKMSEELCNPDQYLECMDGNDGSFSCQCRNIMNERYDANLKECVAMVGRRCRPTGNSPKCEKGSECVDGICECSNGTSLTPMETCAKDYGQQCNAGQCNIWKGLTCHGNSKTCQCIDSYLMYDKKKGSCVAARGSMCGSMKSTSVPSTWGNIMEPAYVECEEGSECKSREVGGKKMTSICM